jgi:hypothetical protein
MTVRSGGNGRLGIRLSVSVEDLGESRHSRAVPGEAYRGPDRHTLNTSVVAPPPASLVTLPLSRTGATEGN